VPAGQIAGRARVIVVNVDHRHAPEHPYPAPLDDVEDATRWVIDHARELGGGGRVAVGGESSGGNLAAAVAVRLRDRPAAAPLVHQLLVYPVLDRDFTTVSYRENGSGHLLTRDAMRLFWSRYLGPAAGADPEGAASPSPDLASPLRLADLTGLPPATILTAEYDPLRDEGERYAARLAAAGVPTRLTRHPGVTHATWYFEGVLGAAVRFAEDAATGLRAGLAGGHGREPRRRRRRDPARLRRPGTCDRRSPGRREDPVLLVHGWGTGREVWHGLAAHLVERHRVIAVDWRNCGASGRTVRGNTVAGIAADIVAVIHRLDLQRVTLVGSSPGGNAVLRAALDHPHLVGRLVLVDAPQHWFADGLDPATFISWVDGLRGDRAQALSTTVQSWFGPGTGPRTREWTVDLLLRSSWVVDDVLRSATDDDQRSRLPDFPRPTLLVPGVHDVEVPLSVPRTAAGLLPRGELVTLPTGHMPHVEAPTLVADILTDFLERSTS
jgi:pimeloyl-ACP methyl ester carboxylesterase